MANNVERGRTEITNTLLQDLKKARTDRPLSLLPQIWTDYKKDELANIYQKHGTQKEKESIYELLFSINPSQTHIGTKSRNKATCRMIRGNFPDDKAKNLHR